jgi:ribosome-dependent ATPase
MAELAGPMLAMGIAIPVIIGLAAAFLKKQAK